MGVWFLPDWLNAFWDTLKSVLGWFLDSAGSLLLGVVKVLFDGFLTTIVLFVNALDWSTLLTKISVSWGALDPNIAYLLVNSGITTGLSVISYAIGIRVLLNLIPAAFTRI